MLHVDPDVSRSICHRQGSEGVFVLRLMTLNVNQYSDRHGAWEARQARIVAAIIALKPHVIALQAVRCDPARAHGQNQAAQLASQLTDYARLHFAPAHTRSDGTVDGIALLARVPLAEIRRYPLPFVGNDEDESRRVLLCARVQTQAGDCWIANGHFSWVSAVNDSNTCAALDHLATLDGPRLLLGDFNATPDSNGMRRLAKEGWVDAWARLRPKDAGFTFEADAPAQRIDYVWADAGAALRLRTIESLGVGAARFSDHLALVVTLA